MTALDDLVAGRPRGSAAGTSAGPFPPVAHDRRVDWRPVDNEPTVPPPQHPRRRRRRLLVLPLAVALLVVSLKLLGMSWWSRQGASAYEDSRYSASQSEFERTRLLNIIDPWKAWLGIGDARFRLNDLVGAEEAFAKALEVAPGRCDVRFNLAVTIEAQGDRLMGGNAVDVTESDELDGLARYRVALDIVNAALCPVDGADGPGARLADTRQRLEAKLGADSSPQDESTMDDPERGEEDADENDTDTQQDAIEDRNETGAAERQDASDINPSEQQPPREPNW